MQASHVQLADGDYTIMEYCELAEYELAEVHPRPTVQNVWEDCMKLTCGIYHFNCPIQIGQAVTS
jgi:hypothetical protein